MIMKLQKVWKHSSKKNCLKMSLECVLGLLMMHSRLRMCVCVL